MTLETPARTSHNQAMLFQGLRAVLSAFVFRFVRLDVEGRIPERGLLAGNHPTIVDGLLLSLLAPRKIRFIAAPELLQVPVLKHVLRWLGAIPAGPDTVQRAAEALQNGDLVLIFPEGTTTQGKQIRPFKTGAERIAALANQPIIPFALDGTQHIYPEGAVIARPARVKITFGEPVTTGLQEAVERLHETIPCERHRTVTSLVVVPLSLAATLLHRTKPARTLVKRLE